MNLLDLDRFSKVKGLGIVGTGDFTHPDWRKELSRSLEEVADSGLTVSRGRYPSSSW